MATERRQITGDAIAGDVPISQSKVQRQALIALLLVLLPNLVLTGVGLLMRGQVQQVAEAKAAGHFVLARFLRQVGLNAFLLLPMGAWLWRARTDGGPVAGSGSG
jgi:hypothetical protein